MCLFLSFPVSLVRADASTSKQNHYPIFNVKKRAKILAGGGSGAGCGDGCCGGSSIKSSTQRSLLRNRILAKSPHLAKTQTADTAGGCTAEEEAAMDEMYGPPKDAPASKMTISEIVSELGGGTSEVTQLKSQLHQEKAKRLVAEAEVSGLKELLHEKIAELEECKQRYQELEGKLSNLKKSVSAYKRHGGVGKTNKRDRAEQEHDGEKVEALCMEFIKQAHGSTSEGSLLGAMLNHPLMKSLAGDHMEERYQGSSKYQIVERLKDSLSKLKYRCSSQHHWHAYSAILTAVAPGETNSEAALRHFASDLGVSTKAMAKAMARRALIDDEDGSVDGIWYDENKAQYRSAFTVKHEGHVKTITDWHVSAAQPSANKKDVVWQHKDGKVWHKGDCEQHGCKQHTKHFRTQTYTEGYELFCIAHPQIAAVCSKGTWRSFEPFFIVSPEKNTCLCIYHERMKLLLRQYRLFSKEWHKDCDCECAFCDDGLCIEHVNKDHRELQEHLLCPKKEGSEYYAEKCIKRACHRIHKNKSGRKKRGTEAGCGWKYPRHGVSSVADCPLEVSDAAVEYIDFEDEPYTTERRNGDGGVETTIRTRKVKKTKQSTRKEFMETFRAVSAHFFEHNHVAKKQAEEFEKLIDNLPLGHAVFLEDFSMDYAHVHQVVCINSSA